MIALIRKAAAGLGKAALAPFSSLGRGVASGGPLLWGLHALVLVAVLVGLWFLNEWLELDRMVHAPSRLLRETWLPLLFLLGYGVAWVALWTWRAYDEPAAVSPFPEIDTDWSRAVSAMQRRGVDLVEKPLVLVLGQPASHENDLLAALQISPTFGPTPSAPDSTLRIVANDEAVYVVCHDASLLSTTTERVLERRAACRRQAAAAPLAVEKAIPVALRVGGEEYWDGATAEEPIDTFDAETDFGPTEKDDPRPLVSTAEADDLAERFQHLMQLIQRDRDPVLPVDGVAAVFHCDAIDNRRSAEAASDALRQDLDILGAAGVHCPVVAIGADLQHVDGAGRLLHALPAERKSRSFGATLPPDELDSESALRGAVDWLTASATPALCQRLYQFDSEGAADLQDNAALFRFESEITRRGEHLADLLAEGLTDEDGGTWPCVGIYLVATGDALGGSQAFGAGVLESLIAGCSRAAWTDDAVERDTHQGRLVTYGYAGVAAAAVLVIGAAIL